MPYIYESSFTISLMYVGRNLAIFITFATLATQKSLNSFLLYHKLILELLYLYIKTIKRT